MFRYKLLVHHAWRNCHGIYLGFCRRQARVGGGFSGGSRGARTSRRHPLPPPRLPPRQFSVRLPNPASAAPIGQTGTRPGLFGGGLFGGLAARLPRRRSIWLAVRARIFWRHGGVRLHYRPAVASRAGRDCRPVGLWWQRRNMPAPADAGADSVTGHSFSGSCGMLGGANVSPSGEPYHPTSRTMMCSNDYWRDPATYSAEDRAALRARSRLKCFYFSEQLAENASRELINRVTDVKLLRGDLAEAAREGSTDYVTVAMHFALKEHG